MAYTALYREWRPKTFTEVVGQKQVSETLMRAIRNDRISHAYLFSGPRGTGKTSMARIFARAINCEHGPTEHPCNECISCTHILENKSMDVIEMDAASNRGIEDVRKLRDSIQYLPVEGRKKIIIVDEAHMLTADAWDALLKTIEEPPEHVIFIFATTEEGSFPDTILSRCQRFNFRRITVEDITQHLLRIAEASHINITPEAAQLIATQADGGLRDALTSLEQCAGLTDNEITPKIVEDFLGLAGKDWVMTMTDHLQKGDGAGILVGIKEALAIGIDIRKILESLSEHLRALLIAKVMPDADEIKVYDTYKEAFLKQSESISVEQINMYVRALQNIQNDTRNESNPRIVIEMGLLGICAQLKVEHEELANRVAALEVAERSQQEALLNRIAALENNISSGLSQTAGSNYLANTAATANTPTSETDTTQVGKLRKNTRTNMKGLSSEPTLSGPPKLPPLSMLGTHTELTSRPITPPLQPTPIKGQAPTLQANISSGKGAVIGNEVRLPSEYKTIHSNVIKWLQAHNKGMTAGFYNFAELTFIDENQVVLVFNNNFNVTMATKSNVYKEAQEAFSNVIGYAVDLTVIASGTEEDRGYRAAAQAIMQSGVKNEPKIDTTPEDGIAVENFGVTSTNSVEKATESHEELPRQTLTIEEVEKLPRWDPSQMTEEERNNPLLATTLTKLAEDSDIYIEVINDEEE